ncbi:unnamed protein product [Microthlaspi erraticum]|uniref:Association with the SNF1 complex (ASC) domain-containing protein n=1 Tax=Microthlaspi erraticum TaxID=1685480 RepID=A0A6D2JJ64_9BRAS|nr:unnamed protein product [Microthlaspi erraticum]
MEPSLNPLREQIWRLKIDPKIEVFLWKLLCGAIPLAERLLTRGPWKAPPQSWVKCNIGFSWSKRNKLAGASWVLRDENGVVLLHSRRAFANLKNAEEGKFLCFCWAMEKLLLLLSEFDDWKVALEGLESNRGANLIAQSVTNDRRLYSYVASCHPSWLNASEKALGGDYIFNMNNQSPEDTTVEGFEVPVSPVSSYNNVYSSTEDETRDPPAVPPHLQHTLLGNPGSTELDSVPQNVVLNHLYIENRDAPRSVVALGFSHRFRSKYVTVVIYKPVQRRGNANV